MNTKSLIDYFNKILPLDDEEQTFVKEAFKEMYNITAGYLDGNLVCFYSTLINGDTLEANLAGFEEETNLNCSKKKLKNSID